VATENHGLSSKTESIFTWRRAGFGFHPYCIRRGNNATGGNMYFVLPLFRLMRANEYSPSRATEWGAISKLRVLGQRLWNLVARHCQGGPYIFLVHSVPDFVSAMLGQLQRTPKSDRASIRGNTAAQMR
jgi:hypothetical protein